MLTASKVFKTLLLLAEFFVSESLGRSAHVADDPHGHRLAADSEDPCRNISSSTSVQCLPTSSPTQTENVCHQVALGPVGSFNGDQLAT